MKVICIKFTSAEEIICRVVESGLIPADSSFEGEGPWLPKGTVKVEKIRTITFQPVGQNQIGIAFVPWSIGSTDGEVIIDLEQHAVAVYKPDTEIENGYLQQTSKLDLSGSSRPNIKL